MSESTRIDKRLKSVRSLPKGNFQMLRQMFDTNIKHHYEKQNIVNGVEHERKRKSSLQQQQQQQSTDNILQLPYTDDEKSSHLTTMTTNTAVTTPRTISPFNKSCLDDDVDESDIYLMKKNWDLKLKTKIDDDEPKYEFLTDFQNDLAKGVNLNKTLDSCILEEDETAETETAEAKQEDVECKGNENVQEVIRQPEIKERPAIGNNLMKTKFLSKSCNLSSSIRFEQFDDIELSDTSLEDDEDDGDKRVDIQKSKPKPQLPLPPPQRAPLPVQLSPPTTLLMKPFLPPRLTRLKQLDVTKSLPPQSDTNTEEVKSIVVLQVPQVPAPSLPESARIVKKVEEQANTDEKCEPGKSATPPPTPTPKLHLDDQEIYIKLKDFQKELNKSFNIDTQDELRIEPPIESTCPVALNDHIYETVGSTVALNESKRKCALNETLSSNASLFNDDKPTNEAFVKSSTAQWGNNKIDKKSLMLSSKLTVSEPNLADMSKDSKNESSNPFTKAFHLIKKTFSRKSLNNKAVNEDTLSRSSIASIAESASSLHSIHERCIDAVEDVEQQPTIQEPQEPVQRRLSDFDEEPKSPSKVYNSIIRRVRNNRKIYETLSSGNNQIYIDDSDFSLLKSLFSYCLIVGLRLNTIDGNRKVYEPYVMWKFPDNGAMYEYRVVEFCFPDPNYGIETKNNENEIFQFTLTNLDGTRTFGFCLKLYTKTSLPIVFCIVSPIDASEMYNTILMETEKLYNQLSTNESLDECKCFLSALYSKPLPARGGILNVTFGTRDSNEIELRRSYDKRLEHVNLNLILEFQFEFMIKIFGSILAERKIVFLSSRLSTLSATIQAFETLLYPFSWPHTFIPVLPSYLIEMCEAPTPYLIGLMRHNKHELMKNDITDVLIVDLDKQKFYQEDGNELNILPIPIRNWIKADVQNLLKFSKLCDENEKNIMLCATFMRVFVRTIGHYNDHFIDINSSNRDRDSFGNRIKKFNYEAFIEAVQNPQIIEFLQWFTRTQLFEVFIAKKETSANATYGVIFENAIKEWKRNQTDSVSERSSINDGSVKIKKIKHLKEKDKFRKLRF